MTWPRSAPRKDAPPPLAPKSGLPGRLTTPPDRIPDVAPDLFADPPVPIGDVYGYNWGWANYDLGCGSDFLRDPVAVTNTQSANVVMSMLGGMLAGLATLEQMAESSSLVAVARHCGDGAAVEAAGAGPARGWRRVRHGS